MVCFFNTREFKGHELSWHYKRNMVTIQLKTQLVLWRTKFKLLVPRSTHWQYATESSRHLSIRIQLEPARGSDENSDSKNLQLYSSRASCSLTNHRVNGSTNNHVGQHIWGEGLSCRSRICITELKSDISLSVNLRNDIEDALTRPRRINPSDVKIAKISWTSACKWPDV
jgi:hypothetical protein